MPTYDILSDGTLCERANDRGNDELTWYHTTAPCGPIQIGFDEDNNAKRVKSSTKLDYDVLSTLSQPITFH